MNATNRVLNRALLLLVGVVLALAGATAILATTRPLWAKDATDAVTRWVEAALSGIAERTVGVPVVGDVSALVLLALAVASVLLLLLIVFIATRGGGRIATVLRVVTEHGTTTVDRNVADAVLAARLRDRTDVLSAHTSVYRIRRAPAIELAVKTRQGARLPQVLQAAEAAVSEWDAFAGSAIPVVLRLEGRGWWDGWRSAVRTR